MTNFKKTAMVALLAGLGFTGTSQASLVARAGGMVYDDVHNITWAADANLFKTQAAGNANLVSEIIAGNGGIILDTPNYYNPSGTYELTTADFNTDTGRMTWWGAQAWANNLTLGGVKGWSLPGTPVEEYGYNVTSSPMGDLFYNQFGATPGLPIEGTALNPNYKLFTNVHSEGYWSSSEYVNGSPLGAWFFNTERGIQDWGLKIHQNIAWAVRPGDVAAVPVPAAVWLFGSGLIGLLSFTRRKNKTVNLMAA